MLLTSINTEDIQKYFGGIYIKIPEYGDLICYVEKVLPEALLLLDSDDNHLALELDGKITGKSEYLLEYIIPKKCYFQFEESAYFLTRIPAKQWKKGISKSNTAVYKLSGGKFHAQSIDFKILRQYTNKHEFPSIFSAHDYSTAALSSRIALDCSTGILYCDITAIGKYLAKENTVVVKKLFYKEIEFFFPNKKVVFL